MVRGDRCKFHVSTQKFEHANLNIFSVEFLGREFLLSSIENSHLDRRNPIMPFMYWNLLDVFFLESSFYLIGVPEEILHYRRCKTEKRISFGFFGIDT